MAGEATVTFFHHSGFTVAVGDTLLVFDYWEDREQPEYLPAPRRLQNGDFAGYQQILVFVSHSHYDHFDEAIYRWDEKLPIHYIISYELPESAKGTRVNPGERWGLINGELRQYDAESGKWNTEEADPGVQADIRVFSSTDTIDERVIGVSYYVTVGGLHIFHAGDLNFWHWQERNTPRAINIAQKAFYQAVEPIKPLPVDLAMFPLDPRMGRLYEAGANYFIMAVKPRLFIPMHWQGNPDVQLKYSQDGHTAYTEVLALTKPRERAELAFEPHELHIRVYTDDYRPGAAGDVKLSAYEPGDPFAETDLPVNIKDTPPKKEKH